MVNMFEATFKEWPQTSVYFLLPELGSEDQVSMSHLSCN